MSFAAVQRTLFRMQCDPAFAAQFFHSRGADESAAGLDAEGLGILLAADPVRIAADPGGRRRAQLLSNLSAEFELSARVADEGPLGPGVAPAFFASVEFHDAARRGASLPPAFGAYLARRAVEARDLVVRGLSALERAMADARRGPRADFVAPPRDAVALAPCARVVRLPTPVVDAAAAAKERLVAGATVGLRKLFSAENLEEIALVVAAPRVSPHRFPELRVERLPPGIADLVVAARIRFDDDAARALAERAGVEPSDVRDCVDGLVADGALVRGE